jgi:hypothetical protein
MFREELADESAATGSDRHADGQLVQSGCGSREHEVGDVCAGDEQDESNSAIEKQERWSNCPNHRFVPAFERDPHAGVLGKVPLQPSGND